MIESILEIDKDLFIFLNGLGTKPFDWFWLMITSKISNIILYIFLSFIYFQKTNLKQLIVLLLSLSLMILFTDQVTN
ncbi:MAG: phosphatase PAP2 family protein, partial [Flavobacteriales bacterium]|nr:phosphatase PAP2 family protein [Flavobacteriales bacterium]